jgi:hypothetical protein
MNLPPDSPNERRAVPRHIRDAEHEQWPDAAETASGAGNPRRHWRVLVYVVVIAVLVAGLWFFNAQR